MTAVVEWVPLQLAVLVLNDHTKLFFLLPLLISLVLLVHLPPFLVRTDEVGLTPINGFELFAIGSHLFEVLNLKRQAVHVSVVCERVGIHPILIGKVHVLPRHTQSIKRG